MYYLAMFSARNKCLKVIESKSGKALLEFYALQHTTGKKLAVICDESETVIMYFRGQGNNGLPKKVTDPSDDPEGIIGGKVVGISK